MARRPTSPARAEHGFALIETLCVLAIAALLAAIVLPALPRATSRARLEGFATETAAILKADRIAALRRGAVVSTAIDAPARRIRAGGSTRVLDLPADVAIAATLPARCGRLGNGRSIDFFASGRSCGGVLALSLTTQTYEVRVNWLTGGVDIVARPS